MQIFDAIVAWNSGPWSGPRLLGDWGSDHTSIDLALFGVLGDPRAVAVVVERWKTFAPGQARRSAIEMPAWASWRKQAAAVIGALGSASDIAFLEAQAAATKDKAVRRSCTAAIAATQARAVTLRSARSRRSGTRSRAACQHCWHFSRTPCPAER